MDKIHVFWGADQLFNTATKNINNKWTIAEVLEHIDKRELYIHGVEEKEVEPLQIEDLVINTDDYGLIKEWALLAFSNNVLQNKKLDISNLWLNNPPIKIYEDIIRIYPNIVEEIRPRYKPISPEILKTMIDTYEEVVIGQKNIMVQIASALYHLKNDRRKKPVSILFLGESGVGKTETAKFISECLGNEMLRIQFSMQQTNEAYKFIFGSEHGENSLARELVRKDSNIVLLDEFDKVHSSFYNAFYQMFDEGVFVDSNYSVNVEKSIIICTTNYKNESDAEKHLGMPIYSRFSKVIKFNDISKEDRVLIASKIYQDLLENIDNDDVNLIKDNDILSFFTENISKGLYKNIRMLKNDMEDAINYEILKRMDILSLG